MEALFPRNLWSTDLSLDLCTVLGGVFPAFKVTATEILTVKMLLVLFETGVNDDCAAAGMAHVRKKLVCPQIQ